MYGLSNRSVHVPDHRLTMVRCAAQPRSLVQVADDVYRRELAKSSEILWQRAALTWTAYKGVDVPKTSSDLKKTYVWCGQQVDPFHRFNQQIKDDWDGCPAPTQTASAVTVYDEECSANKLLCTLFNPAEIVASELLGVKVRWQTGWRSAGRGGRLSPDFTCKLEDGSIIALAEVKTPWVVPDLSRQSFFDFVPDLKGRTQKNVFEDLKPSMDVYKNWATFSQVSTYAVEFETPNVMITTGAATVFLHYRGDCDSVGSSKELVAEASQPILCDSLGPTLLQATITFTMMAYQDHINKIKLLMKAPITEAADIAEDEFEAGFTSGMERFTHEVFRANEVLTGTVLGNGTVGRVWEGVFHEQHVAIKQAHISWDEHWEDVCEALVNELQVLEHMEGASVVPKVLAVGTLVHPASWSPVIVMTRAPGKQLDQLLLSLGDELCIEDKRRLHSKIMDGLAELHDRGVIHGDLEARHIIVDIPHAEAPRITFIDFSIGSIGATPADLQNQCRQVLETLHDLGLKHDVTSEPPCGE